MTYSEHQVNLVRENSHLRRENDILTALLLHDNELSQLRQERQAKRAARKANKTKPDEVKP